MVNLLDFIVVLINQQYFSLLYFLFVFNILYSVRGSLQYHIYIYYKLSEYLDLCFQNYFTDMKAFCRSATERTYPLARL